MGWQMKAPHVCMEQLLDGRIGVLVKSELWPSIQVMKNLDQLIGWQPLPIWNNRLWQPYEI